MAFQQGLSGLDGASKALDVISNNVANANTVGFKNAVTKFGDVYASALNGSAAGIQIGIGVSVGAVSQSFNQGNLTTTNNPLDLAINGNGFFCVQKTDGTLAYTRNGQYELNKNGNLVNAAGLQLLGYPANAAGQILPATPSPIKLDTSDLQPAQTSKASLGLNLDSRSKVPTVAFASTAANPIPDPLSYNSSTSITIYDSLGNSHIETMYFVKDSAAAGSWSMYASTDGGVATGPTNLSFDTSGKMTTAMPLTATADIANSIGAVDPFSFSLDFTGSTQYGNAFGVNKQIQDGYASGRLSGTTVASDGTIQGRYSNGQSKVLGQTVLANFANPNGLASLGDNIWAESPDSGQPMVGAPNSGTLGSIQAGSVEDSNVDLTKALVDMITYQRSYQANSQSIKTQDQIMQTLVNLR
ncbi:flagellar hook protein FlgE [Niveibacterium terrae]|uniref:flagellar hook protein FlgE n=1 Tax=Niveibacterium terrae TaxID=3373598 RepID=UPI003A90B9FD